MTSHFSLRVLALVFAALAAGCSRSDLESVQQSVMPGSPGLTVQQALGKNPSCGQILWREDVRDGMTLVTARCPIAELYGVRESVKARLGEIERDARARFEQRRAARTSELQGLIDQAREAKSAIERRKVTKKQARENIRAGGASDCAYFERMAQMFVQTIQADEALITSECAKGEPECTAAKSAYEDQIRSLQVRRARIMSEMENCQKAKSAEKDRVRSLNEQYEAAAQSEQQARQQDLEQAASRLKALTDEMQALRALQGDEELGRQLAAIGQLRRAAQLERLAVELEFTVAGSGERRKAELTGVLSEFTWQGADAYGLRHGGRTLSRYGVQALLSDAAGRRALWDCMRSPASHLSCRDLAEDIFAAYRERFSLQ